jgi:hypothetical protein
MKRFTLILCILALMVVAGCEGTMYNSGPMRTRNGTVTIVGRTGAFGTDSNHTIYEQDPACVSPTVTAETYTERHFDSHKSKCGSPSQNRDFYFENETTYTRRQIPNPMAQPPKVIVTGGTNESTGNRAIPAALRAAGEVGAAQVFDAGETVITNVNKASGGKANATGGSADIGPITNVNKNLNANDNDLTSNTKVKTGVDIDAYFL